MTTELFTRQRWQSKSSALDRKYGRTFCYLALQSSDWWTWLLCCSSYPTLPHSNRFHVNISYMKMNPPSQCHPRAQSCSSCGHGLLQAARWQACNRWSCSVPTPPPRFCSLLSGPGFPCSRRMETGLHSFGGPWAFPERKWRRSCHCCLGNLNATPHLHSRTNPCSISTILLQNRSWNFIDTDMVNVCNQLSILPSASRFKTAVEVSQRYRFIKSDSMKLNEMRQMLRYYTVTSQMVPS